MNLSRIKSPLDSLYEQKVVVNSLDIKSYPKFTPPPFKKKIIK